MLAVGKYSWSTPSSPLGTTQLPPSVTTCSLLISFSNIFCLGKCFDTINVDFFRAGNHPFYSHLPDGHCKYLMVYHDSTIWKWKGLIIYWDSTFTNLNLNNLPQLHPLVCWSWISGKTNIYNTDMFLTTGWTRWGWKPRTTWRAWNWGKWVLILLFQMDCKDVMWLYVLICVYVTGCEFLFASLAN